MSKEDWVRCYERAEAEHEGATEEQLRKIADEKFANLGAARINAAMEWLREEGQS